MKVHNSANQRRIRALDRRLAYETTIPVIVGKLENGECVFSRSDSQGGRLLGEKVEAKRARAAQIEIANLREKIIRA